MQKKFRPDENDSHDEYISRFFIPMEYGFKSIDSIEAKAEFLNFFTQDLLKSARNEFIESIDLDNKQFDKIEKAIEYHVIGKIGQRRSQYKALLNCISEYMDYRNVDYNYEYQHVNDKYKIELKSLINYIETARKINEKYLRLFIEGTEPDSVSVDNSLTSITFFRGIYNNSYYKSAINGSVYKNTSDFISKYASTPEEDLEYQELRFITSYSFSMLVSHKFMITDFNARRAIISIPYELIEDRVLSSFLVSKYLDNNQYEFMCMPSLTQLYIKNIANTEDFSIFEIRDQF